MNFTLSIVVSTKRTAGAVAGTLLAFVAASGSAVAQDTSTDLRTVYEQSKTYDAEYQASQFDLQAAIERVPLARSAFLPQLAIGAEAGISSASGDVQGSFEETSLSLTLNQSIFNRANSQILNQTQIGVKQAEAQYAATGQALILRVATAYFDVLRAQADVEFSQSELQACSHH